MSYDHEHDDECEAEYVEIAHAYSPCACQTRAAALRDHQEER